MSKIRLKFEKGEEVRYISHLDLMRVFARAIKRAKVPIKYSQGFNPHPLISIAFPLSVGITGREEYIDLELEQDLEIAKIIDFLNSKFPKGIKVLEGEYVENNKYLDSIAKAKYNLQISCSKMPEDIVEKIREILSKDELEVEKRGKKRGRKVMKTVNIKPDILSFEIEEIKDNMLYSSGLFTTGKAKTLNPNLFLTALGKYIENLEIDYAKVSRIKLMQ